MASSNSTSQGLVLWERVREWISGSDQEATLGRDEPHHRGWAITICVLISILLWFTLTMRDIYMVTLQLPTRIENLSDDVALTELPPSSVQVQVRGEAFQLLQLRYDPTAIPIDASSDQIDFESAALNLPKNVELEGVNPSTFTLRKDERISRTLPIRLRADLQTAETFELLSPPRIEPDSVTISGARSIVNRMSMWPTERIERAGLKDSLEVQVALSDTLAGLVTKGRTHTTLQAAVEQFTQGTREIKVIPQEVPSSEQLVTLDPSTVRVVYKVPLSQYEAAQEAPDFYATVSYDEIRADTTGRVRPELHLPENLTLRDADLYPPTLRYYLSVEN